MSRSSKRKSVEIEELQKKAHESLNYAQNKIMEDKVTHRNNLINPPPPPPPNKPVKKSNIVEKNMNQQGVDDDNILNLSVEKLITNLKIISNIKQNEKIYMNENNIIEIDKSFIPSFTRYFNERCRNRTILFLQDIINNVLICTDSILTDEQDELESNSEYNNCTFSNDFTEYNSDILQRFILEINKSFDGFDNLIKTYENDITIISEITVLKEKLTTRCVKINNVLRIKKNNLL